MAEGGITEELALVATADGPMQVFTAAPRDGLAAPGVLVLQEAFGVNHHIKEVCRRLAREGFRAAAPELYHRTGRGVDVPYADFAAAKAHLAALTNRGIETDLNAALEGLRRPGVPAPAVVGYCLGGFAAFLAACRCDVRCAVSCYGGGILRARPGIGLEPLAGEADRRRAPLLCVFGAEDPVIPPSDVEAIRAALHGSPVVNEVVVFAAAAHGFCCDERDAYRPGPASGAWARTLAWLRQPPAA